MGAGAASGLRHEGQGHHRGAGEILAGLLVADIEELLQSQAGASMARALCTSTRMSPEWTGIG